MAENGTRGAAGRQCWVRSDSSSSTLVGSDPGVATEDGDRITLSTYPNLLRELLELTVDQSGHNRRVVLRLLLEVLARDAILSPLQPGQRPRARPPTLASDSLPEAASAEAASPEVTSPEAAAPQSPTWAYVRNRGAPLLTTPSGSVLEPPDEPTGSPTWSTWSWFEHMVTLARGPTTEGSYAESEAAPSATAPPRTSSPAWTWPETGGAPLPTPLSGSVPESPVSPPWSNLSWPDQWIRLPSEPSDDGSHLEAAPPASAPPRRSTPTWAWFENQAPTTRATSSSRAPLAGDVQRRPDVAAEVIPRRAEPRSSATATRNPSAGRVGFPLTDSMVENLLENFFSAYPQYAEAHSGDDSDTDNSNLAPQSSNWEMLVEQASGSPSLASLHSSSSDGGVSILDVAELRAGFVCGFAVPRGHFPTTTTEASTSHPDTPMRAGNEACTNFFRPFSWDHDEAEDSDDSSEGPDSVG